MGKTKRVSQSNPSKKAKRAVRCCECEGREEVGRVVVGIGSAYSDLFAFPVKKPAVVNLCADCEQNHGDLDECAVCKLPVIGPVFMGKCRLCLPESAIWKVLEETDAASKIREHEEAAYLDDENLYAIFFGDDGETPPPGIMAIVDKAFTEYA
jgi:hypothetical protein